MTGGTLFSSGSIGLVVAMKPDSDSGCHASNSSRGEAKQYGTVIHKILAEIITKDDVRLVIDKYCQQGEINIQEKNKIDNRFVVTLPYF